MRYAQRGHNAGLVLIELLTVAAIVGMILALLLPVVLQAREAARRMNCQNNQKQIGLALQSFQSIHGAFPPSKTAAHGPISGECDVHEVAVEDNPQVCTEHQSWTESCLSLLDESPVEDEYHFDRPWSSLTNRPVVTTHIALFICPSVPEQQRADPHYVRGAAATDYATVHQVEIEVFTDLLGVSDPGIKARRGALAEYVANPPHQITDGLSKTILGLECAGRPYSYVLGRRMTVEQFVDYGGDEIVAINGNYVADDGIGWADPENVCSIKGKTDDGLESFGPKMINATNIGEAYSFHPGGALFLFADGSVHMLDDAIDAWVYVSLCTRAGNEVLDDFIR